MFKRVMSISITVLLILAIAVIFIPICFPVQLSNFKMNGFDYNRPYENSLMITISSDESGIMDDLIFKYEYYVDNQMSETYKTTEIMSGDNSFRWEQLFKFDTLKNKNPFNKHTIIYDDLAASEASGKPGETIMLYDIATEAQNLNISATNPGICVDALMDGDFFAKLKLTYTFKDSGDKSQQLFNKCSDFLLHDAEFINFYKLAENEEEKLNLNSETKKLYLLQKDIYENIQISSVSFTVNTFFSGCKSLEVTFNGTYRNNGQNVPLTICITQTLNEFYDSVEAMFVGLNQVAESDLTAEA